MAKSKKQAEVEEIEGVEEQFTVAPGISRLVEMRDSPTGLTNRDAVLAAVVDAVIEMGGGGAANVGPATEIEKNS